MGSSIKRSHFINSDFYVVLAPHWRTRYFPDLSIVDRRNDLGQGEHLPSEHVRDVCYRCPWDHVYWPPAYRIQRFVSNDIRTGWQVEDSYRRLRLAWEEVDSGTRALRLGRISWRTTMPMRFSRKVQNRNETHTLGPLYIWTRGSWN